MMDHAEARMLASARGDGELDSSLVDSLEQHLASCETCRAFAGALPRLSSLAASLPPERRPAAFDSRIAAAIARDRVRARRRWVRPVAAIAAVVAVSLLFVTVGIPVRTFRLEPAHASAALLRIRSLDVTRQIVDENLREEPVVTRTIERIRYRAPADLRIERTITGPSGTHNTLEIRRPGVRYTVEDGAAKLETGLPPEENPIPEPLSPTMAIVGRDVGPGPAVAGRPTRRVEINAGEVKRSGLIDASDSAVLDASVSAVLDKGGFQFGERTSKHTLSIAYNPVLDGSLFDIPSIRATDSGFKPVEPQTLSPRPAAAPRGFDLVLAGTDTVGGGWLLYQRGSFPVLVRLGFTPPFDTDRTVSRYPASVGRRPADFLVGLYDLPTLSFSIDGRGITISAPLEQGGLELLALRMFPQSARE